MTQRIPGGFVVCVDPETGEEFLMSAEEYLGSNPGIGMRRARDLGARLPDAELAGYQGRGIVPHGSAPNERRRNAPETWRPLAGAPQQARGNGKIITVGGSNPTNVVDAIVQTPQGQGEDAESICVTLGYDTGMVAAASLAELDLDITATLAWGVGGANFSAEVDWMNGTTFVLPANFVRVGARLNINTAPTEEKIVLFASLAYGQSTGGRLASPIRKTETVSASIAPGVESDPIAIPKFGISMNLIDTQDITGTYLITFFKNAGLLLPVAKYVKTGRSDLVGLSDSQFEVPNNSMFFSVRNIGGNLVENVKAVFNLGL